MTLVYRWYTERLRGHYMPKFVKGDRVTVTSFPGSTGTVRGEIPNLVDPKVPAVAVDWDPEWRDKIAPIGSSKTLKHIESCSS